MERLEQSVRKLLPVVAATAILLFGGKVTQAQEIACFSKLYEYIGRNIKAGTIDTLYESNGFFFSLLLKTNPAGKISEIRSNEGLDIRLKRQVEKLRKEMPSDILLSCKYKAASFLLPVFLIYEKPPLDKPLMFESNQLSNLWNFHNNLILTEKVILLPPMQLYYSSGSIP